MPAGKEKGPLEVLMVQAAAAKQAPRALCGQAESAALSRSYSR